MSFLLGTNILSPHRRRPSGPEVRDAAGKMYIVMTSQQFQKYV